MKRALSSILIAILLLGLLPGAALAADDRVLIYEDELDGSGAFLQAIDGARLNNGRAVFSSSWGDLKFASNGKMVWKDFTLEFDLYWKSTPKGDCWWGIDAFEHIFLIRPDGSLRYSGPGVSETSLANGKFQQGKRYVIRFIRKGKALAFYSKPEGAGAFEQLAVIQAAQLKETYGMRLRGNIPMEADNIRIYGESGQKNLVKNKLSTISMGSEASVDIANATGKFTYESKSPTVAQVDENGKITALKKGIAVIDIKDESGTVVEGCVVSVIIPIAMLRFSYEGKPDKTFYVGESFSLGCNATPGDALLQVEWILSNPEVLKQTGISFKNNSFTAVSPGTCTVTIKDRNGAAEISDTFTVLPAEERPVEESGTTNLMLTGDNHTINTLLGMHITRDDMKNSDMWISELGTNFPIQTVRNEQQWLAAQYTKGTPFDEMNAYPGDKIGNALKVPVYTCLSPSTCSDETSIEIVKRLVAENDSDNPIHIELGNEIYAISFEGRFPKAKDYFEWASNITKQIKAIDPEIKCYAVLLGHDSETNILSDTNNIDALTGDWAYTQAHRVVEWNATGKEYADSFDGFTVHSYLSSENIDGYTAEDYIKGAFAFSNQHYYSILNLYDRLGIDKDIQLTEYGHLCGDVFWAGGFDDAAKIRHQRGKYPISAISNGELLLEQLRTGVVNASHYHTLRDSQGFGVYEGKPEDEKYRTANYHVYKQLLKLVNDYDTYHELQGVNGDYYVIKRPFYWGEDENIVVEDIKAWGFGDESEVKEIILTNHTEVPQTVTLGGAQIKPTWSFGGSEEVVAPSWSINKDYTSWTNYVYALPAAETLLPVPNLYEGAGFADSVEVPPYSMMTVEVSGTPTVIEGHTSAKVSEITEYRLKKALALKVGSSAAYNDNIRVSIDPDNPAIVPVVKDGRTLLPLRFVAESFGCEVSYDNATRGIVIKDKDTEINLTIGSADYTVNGTAKQFDVPAEETGGRTLVPLRALAEALGKDVLWDSRGLIIITNSKTAYLDYDEAAGVIDKEHIDEFDGKIDEVLSLFE